MNSCRVLLVALCVVLHGASAHARVITPKATWVETVTGSPAGTTTSGFADGNRANARFAFPRGVAVDPNTGVLYISDTDNCAIRALDGNFSVHTGRSRRNCDSTTT